MAKKKAEGAEGDAEAPELNSKKKLLVIVAAALLLVGGGGGGFLFWKKAQADSQAEQAAVEPKKPAAFLKVRDMIVNLTPEPGQTKTVFLKLHVALELKDAKAEADVKPLLPRVEDAFQTYTRELRASDLAGSAGLYRLREELLRRVNIAIHPAKADAVLFKNVVVQ